jgi:hypothetical protein
MSSVPVSESLSLKIASRRWLSTDSAQARSRIEYLPKREESQFHGVLLLKPEQFDFTYGRLCQSESGEEKRNGRLSVIVVAGSGLSDQCGIHG